MNPALPWTPCPGPLSPLTLRLQTGKQIQVQGLGGWFWLCPICMTLQKSFLLFGPQFLQLHKCSGEMDNPLPRPLPFDTDIQESFFQSFGGERRINKKWGCRGWMGGGWTLLHCVLEPRQDIVKVSAGCSGGYALHRQRSRLP